MTRRAMMGLLVVGAILLFGGCWSTAGYAGEILAESKRTLPRSFQGVRLGMPRHDLAAAASDIGRAAVEAGERGQRSFAVLPNDRHLRRIEYRFYRNALHEMAIHYNLERIPLGHEGLLARLKESYGEPVAERIEEFDPRPDVFSVKKTVWKDERTLIALAEVRKVREGTESYDLVLTMTDRALQEAYEREQEERRRRQLLGVPIPLSGEEGPPQYRVEPRADRPRTGAAG
ncbi:MAG TPA: hypothetical protein VLA99_03455 [Nitrospiraceae bacterium]|nr:hypothetical protein [Nitrospiraceae bacterium]